MGKKTLEDIITEYIGFGFDPEIIKMAWKNTNHDESKLFDEIFALQQQNKFIGETAKPIHQMDEEALLNKAIQESVDMAKEKKISFQPLNPEQRLRKSGVPVGLKNIGNTCYFNSLLQTYFYNQNFVREVLQFIEPEFAKNVKDSDKVADPELKRKLASVTLVKNLQMLFAGMISSDKKYLDPTAVITNVVDDYGNELPVGDQKDIAEFNLFFLSRVEEAISLQDRYQMHKSASNMEIEGNQDKEPPRIADSPSKMSSFMGDNEGTMRQSVIRVSEQSTVGKEFFGKNETTFINNKENICKSQEEMFNLMYVNVAHKELYTAFEELIVSSIDDYKNEKGETVPVEKQCWVKEAPNTLFFQIERVVYDKEKLALKKIHDAFQFPKQFYIDPFLLENKEQSLNIRKHVNQLRKQKQAFERARQDFQNYNNSGMTLPNLLEQSIHFLSNQMTAGMEVEQPLLSHPTRLSNNVALKNITPGAIEDLRNLHRESQNRIKYYTENIERLNKEIEQSYRKIMSTAPYRLQSILIHEGQAESGHYYSYSYDEQHGVWRKYNDLNVTEETEEQVMKEAKGYNVVSAYCLVYTRAPVDKRVLRNYKLSTDEGYGNDVYSSYILPEVTSLLHTENQVLYHDIQQFKAVGFVNKVIDNYVKRFESCNELSRKLKDARKPADPKKADKKSTIPLLVNLPTYIKSVSTSDDEYKASLMEGTIFSFGPKDDPVFQEVLKNKLTNLSDFKRPKFIHCKRNFHEQYMQNVICSIIATGVYGYIRQEGAEYKIWSKLVAGLQQLRAHSAKPAAAGGASEYFSWLSGVLSKLVVLQLANKVQTELDSKNIEAALNSIRLLSAHHSLTINLFDDSAARNSLVYWLYEMAVKFPQELKPQINRIIEGVQTKKELPEYLPLAQTDTPEIRERLEQLNANDQLWNFSRTEDTFYQDLVASLDSVSNIMKIYNSLFTEFKKSNVPMDESARNKILKAKP